MKNQRGFIQIPILIAIIAGVLVLGGGGYFGVKRYQNYQSEKVEKEKVAIEQKKRENEETKAQEEKEKQAQALTETQQKALEEAQQEIEKLKTENEKTQKKQASLEQKVNTEKTQNAETKDLSISAIEINSYITGVVHVLCKNSSGSGSLWKNVAPETYTLITNKHVIETPYSNGYCFLFTDNIDNKTGGVYLVNTKNFRSWNSQSDVAILDLIPFTNPSFFTNDGIGMSKNILDASKPINNLNYKISELRRCPLNTKMGSNVVIIGYPAFTKQNDQGAVSYARAITNGIISATDASPLEIDLPYTNYYISAKIDSGNSGGIAFSKDENGLCILGIPTWLSVGNYETQGIIQNIHNIFYKQ